MGHILPLSAQEAPLQLEKTAVKNAITLSCDLREKPARRIRQFWSITGLRSQGAECLAKGKSINLEDKIPDQGNRSFMFGMVLGGFSTSTVPALNADGKYTTRNGQHIRINADNAFFDPSTQLKSPSGEPRFELINGTRIPKCPDYYIGKDKDSIGGAGIGGDPQIDTIDHPFVQYYECYKWNGTAYIYDWKPLERRLDAALAVAPISYINPGIPWAFQRGMTFCQKTNPQAFHRKSNGWFEYDGSIYPESMRETPYGNELVPDRLVDYAAFLEAALRYLATNPKYAKALPGWKWKIGQEVDTRFYTRERYFELYKTAVQAIQKVLPDAKIGVHFGMVDVKKGWLPSFLLYCKENRLRCDFIGASRYYQLQIKNKSNPSAIEEWLNSVPRMPNWPAQAKLEIHEYGVGPHPEARDKEVQAIPFYAMLVERLMNCSAFGEMFSPHETPKPCLEWLDSVAGHDWLNSKTIGKTADSEARIGAIFTRDPGGKTSSALLYNYNPNADSLETARIHLSLSGFSQLKPPRISIKSIRSDQPGTDKSIPIADSIPSRTLSLPIDLKANSIAIVTIQL